MTVVTDLLNQIAQGLSLGGLPGSVNAGDLVNVKILPDLGALPFTEIEQHPVDFDLIAKQVVFSLTNTAAPNFVSDPAITKILPMFNLLTVPPQADSSGVPGLIGKLKGSLPVPVVKSGIPHFARVGWTIADENGNPLASGDDFLAPGGLDGPALAFTMLPQFERFDGQIPPPRKLQVTVMGQLVLGSESVPFSVGPVPFLVPVIPLPQVLALTVDSNYQGAALVCVSGQSGVTSINHLKQLLDPVRNALNTVTSVARFAAMLTGLDVLVGVLNAANIELHKGDKLKNLNDITLIQRAWYENDTEAEDELSSFVFLSPPPATPTGTDNAVAMCNDRDLDAGEGRFVVRTGRNFVALCPSLHSGNPVVLPDATIQVTNAADDWNTDSFGDELSSIQFLS